MPLIPAIFFPSIGRSSVRVEKCQLCGLARMCSVYARVSAAGDRSIPSRQTTRDAEVSQHDEEASGLLMAEFLVVFASAELSSSLAAVLCAVGGSCHLSTADVSEGMALFECAGYQILHPALRIRAWGQLHECGWAVGLCFLT